MSIEVKVIADSVAPCGERLISIQATYPRIVLAEVNTHGALAKNSASSRAIPIDKMIQRILDNPGMPVHWGKNQKGMQADEELDEAGRAAAEAWWLESMQLAIEQARKGQALGLHKQVVNRIVEPFQHMVTLISATEWNNFFHLRYHKDADPTFQALARAAYEAIQASTPTELKAGQWHLPYIKAEDHEEAWRTVLLQPSTTYLDVDRVQELLLKVSTGRCARTSYLTQEGKRDLVEDVALHDRLRGAVVVGQPGHWSPFEHQGRAEATAIPSGRFKGFTQYRKLFPNENMTQPFTPPEPANVPHLQEGVQGAHDRVSGPCRGRGRRRDRRRALQGRPGRGPGHEDPHRRRRGRCRLRVEVQGRVMDAETKATLKLIEEESMRLELESRGRQLVYLARDYLEDEDLFEVRRLLRLVDTSYFSDFMHQHIAEDAGYAKAIAHLIEVLGHDFWLFSQRAIATA